MSVRARETPSRHAAPFQPRAVAGEAAEAAAGAWSIRPIASRPSAAGGAAPSPTRPAATSPRSARHSRTAGISRRSSPPLDDRGDRREAAHHHRAQRFARHRLRPLDQSLSRLRARLRPIASRGRPTPSRASRPGLDFETKIFAKPNAPDLLEKELRAKGYEPKTIALGLQHRSLPAARAALPDHPRDPRSARPGEPPGRDRHQIGPRDPRHRHPGPDGRPAARQGGDLDHDPRPASSRAGWSRGPPRPAKRLDTVRRLAEAGIPVTRARRADHPGDQRSRDRGDPESLLPGRRARGRLRAAAPAATISRT